MLNTQSTVLFLPVLLCKVRIELDELIMKKSFLHALLTNLDRKVQEHSKYTMGEGWWVWSRLSHSNMDFCILNNICSIVSY